MIVLLKSDCIIKVIVKEWLCIVLLRVIVLLKNDCIVKEWLYY